MATQWKDVFSSTVTKVGYDPETEEMQVEFKTGRVYAYSGVPPDLADNLSRNWSVGSMLNSDIKGKYPHRRIK